MDYNKRVNDRIVDDFFALESEDSKFISKQMEIAAQIDNYLKETGWSQRELAERAGLRPSQISQILNGSSNPGLRTITRIEEALERDIVVCPDFHEEALEDIGWLRPGDIYVPNTELVVESDDELPETPISSDWQETKQEVPGRILLFKPTGS